MDFIVNLLYSVIAAHTTPHTCCCTILWNISVRKQTTDIIINDKSHRSVATHLWCGRIFSIRITTILLLGQFLGPIPQRLSQLVQSFRFCRRLIHVTNTQIYRQALRHIRRHTDMHRNSTHLALVAVLVMLANYIRQVNAVNGGDNATLAVCEQQSINRPRRHRCTRRR